MTASLGYSSTDASLHEATAAWLLNVPYAECYEFRLFISYVIYEPIRHAASPLQDFTTTTSLSPDPFPLLSFTPAYPHLSHPFLPSLRIVTISHPFC